MEKFNGLISMLAEETKGMSKQECSFSAMVNCMVERGLISEKDRVALDHIDSPDDSYNELVDKIKEVIRAIFPLVCNCDKNHADLGRLIKKIVDVSKQLKKKFPKRPPMNPVDVVTIDEKLCEALGEIVTFAENQNKIKEQNNNRGDNTNMDENNIQDAKSLVIAVIDTYEAAVEAIRERLVRDGAPTEKITRLGVLKTKLGELRNAVSGVFDSNSKDVLTYAEKICAILDKIGSNVGTLMVTSKVEDLIDDAISVAKKWARCSLGKGAISDEKLQELGGGINSSIFAYAEVPEHREMLESFYGLTERTYENIESSPIRVRARAQIEKLRQERDGIKAKMSENEQRIKYELTKPDDEVDMDLIDDLTAENEDYEDRLRDIDDEIINVEDNARLDPRDRELRNLSRKLMTLCEKIRRFIEPLNAPELYVAAVQALDVELITAYINGDHNEETEIAVKNAFQLTDMLNDRTKLTDINTFVENKRKQRRENERQEREQRRTREDQETKTRTSQDERADRLAKLRSQHNTKVPETQSQTVDQQASAPPIDPNKKKTPLPEDEN